LGHCRTLDPYRAPLLREQSLTGRVSHSRGARQATSRSTRRSHVAGARALRSVTRMDTSVTPSAHEIPLRGGEISFAGCPEEPRRFLVEEFLRGCRSRCVLHSTPSR
jgi:hypothetical protein